MEEETTSVDTGMGNDAAATDAHRARLRAVHELSGHDETVQRLAWSADGHMLATASVDGTIGIWDVDSGKAIQRLRGHSGGVNQVAFGGLGRIASASYDGHVIIWDYGSAERVSDLILGSDVRSVAWSNGLRRLAAATTGGTVAFFDFDADERPVQRRTTSAREVGPIVGFELSRDGHYAASFGECLGIWEMRSGRLLTVRKTLIPEVIGGAWHPDGHQLAVATRAGTVSVFEWSDVNTVPYNVRVIGVARDQQLNPRLCDVTYSFDGLWIAALAKDGTIHVWRIDQDVPVCSVRGTLPLGQPTCGAAFHPSRWRLAYVTGRHTVVIADLSGGQPPRGVTRPTATAASRGVSRPIAAPPVDPLTPKGQSRVVTPAAPVGFAPLEITPATDELWLRVREGEVGLHAANGVLWQTRISAPGPEFAFELPSGERFDLADIRSSLTAWDRRTLLALGNKLATALFGDNVPDKVQAALAVPPDQKRRLVLDLQASVAALPWEYLALGDLFLLDQRVSIVRQVDSGVVARAVQLKRPLRVLLFACANPPNSGHVFDAEGHRARIEGAVQEPTGRVHIHSLSRCSERVLRDALEDPRLDGFHFLGHGEGGSEPSLVVWQDDGRGALFGSTLAAMLVRSGVQFAFLGACHSGAVPPDNEFGGVASAIVRAAGIPVVAMQASVTQAFSTEFAADFYRKLHGAGYDVERAVWVARTIEQGDRHAFGIPVLLADWRQGLSVPDPPPPCEWKLPLVVVQVATGSAKEASRAWAQVLPPTMGNALLESLQGVSTVTETVPLPAGAPGSPEFALSLADLLHMLGGRRQTEIEHWVSTARRGEETPAPPPPPLLPVAHVEPIDDLAFHVGDCGRLTERLKEVRTKLVLDPDFLPRVVGELAARHVLLIGPPGTGKTQVARELVAALGYEPKLATASADWTAFDIVGGFWPRSVPSDSRNGGRLEFGFRPGVFTDAVLANWRLAPSAPNKVAWQRARGKVLGTWLILDELNRADMDRALGSVFTALESGLLTVPNANAAGDGPAFAEIPIPKDFRVIATMNGVDRHYLYRLSDGLKRRFAFVELPVTTLWREEWTTLSSIERLDTGADDQQLWLDLRRFVYLCRLLHPVGTAQLRGAMGFLAASRDLGLDDSVRLSQALVGSIVPSLEEAGPAVIELMTTWAETRDSTSLLFALQEATAQRQSGSAATQATQGPLARFESLLAELESDPRLVSRAAPPQGDRCLERLSQLLARQSAADPLEPLMRNLRQIQHDQSG